MKIFEIITETKHSTDEAAPMGMLARAGHTIASKLGSTSSTAALDVGKRANEIFKSFQNWALRAGVDISSVSVKTLKDWGKSQGLPVPTNLGPDTAVYDLRDKENIQTVFTGLSQQAYAKGPVSGAQLGQKYGLDPAQVSASQSKRTSSSASPTAGRVNQMISQITDTRELNRIKAAVDKALGQSSSNPQMQVQPGGLRRARP